MQQFVFTFPIVSVTVIQDHDEEMAENEIAESFGVKPLEVSAISEEGPSLATAADLGIQPTIQN